MTEIKYYITLHPNAFPTKESFDLGKITNWFKRKGQSKRFSIEEIFEFCSQGRCFIPSNIETDGEEYEFISSRLMFVDVDDDERQIHPKKVLRLLNGTCAGLFYTSSHSEEKYRYRLVFVLSETIRDERIYVNYFKILVNRLKEIGIPADAAITTPLQRIRTATKGYIIHDANAKFPVSKLRKVHKKNKEQEMKIRQEKIKQYAKSGNEYVYSVEELKDRAHAIGYVDDWNLWANLSYSLKSYVNAGFIEDIDGYEVFSILCGGNDETKHWESIKNTRITIGTFIKYSNDAGFKKSNNYYHYQQNTPNGMKIEYKKVEKYIPLEFSKELLFSEQDILVKSPTGSGKTHSFVNGAKQVSKELEELGKNRFYIFAVPTIAITDQVAADNKILPVRGETPNLFNNVSQYIKGGNRVFVCTYDMAKSLSEMIKTIREHSSFGVIVDEVHQLVHNYDYRRRAINELYELRKTAVSFIGLSGTPEDVLRDMFEREVHIQTKNEKAPCSVWGALLYDKREEEEPLLFQLINQKVKSKKKLLVFIQSKEMINRIYDRLVESKIRVEKVTSDGKEFNATYNTLVKESKFPKGVQVILTTSVLSDGINIKNENRNYDTIMVTSQTSQMFNVDQARQCANRFRNDYEGFYIFMLKPRKTTERLFSIEADFKYEKHLAQNAIDLINEEFEGKDNYKLARIAAVEKRFNIQFNEDGIAEYDALRLRHNSSKEKNLFYALFRYQFIDALTPLMGFKASSSINVSEYMIQNNVDLSGMIEEIDKMKELAESKKDEKAAQIGFVYKKHIYDAFIEENDEILKFFKEATIMEHYNCLKKIVYFTDFQTSLSIVKQVDNRRNMHAFHNRIDALINLKYFGKVNRKTPSKEAYEALNEYSGKELTKKDIEALIKSVSKRFKRSRTVDVESIFTNYFKCWESSRDMRTRYKMFRPVTIEDVCEEFELSEYTVKTAMNKKANIEGGNLAKVIIA